jgi:ankyrin repeat protein
VLPPHFKIIFASLIALFVLLGAYEFSPQPRVRSQISADEFVRALAEHRTSLTDFYLQQRMDPNARASQDRPLLLAATLQKNSRMVQHLLAAGACADLADDTGLTPLMAAALNGDVDLMRALIPLVTNVNAADLSRRTALHYAVAARKIEAVELLLRVMVDVTPTCNDGRDALAIALDNADKPIAQLLLDRLPTLQQWTVGTRRALQTALAADDKDQIRMLLKKHAVPPTPEGKKVPLLAWALAQNDASLFYELLICGADPNTTLPAKCDKDFLEALPGKHLGSYIEGDKGVNVLMLAAGLGQPDYVRSLLDAGADRNRMTSTYKMLPLYFAARTDSWRCTQILLGSGPPPDRLRIEISLAMQHIDVIRDGKPVFQTVCSTGRQGFSTKTGSFVITDKARYHRSTIYKVEMPYFMRLSCLDFGMHEGVVPNYPASHGCIRMPGEAARKLFAEIPVGTLVTVKN